MRTKLGFGAAAVAAALLSCVAMVVPAGIEIASAAPPGARAGLAADRGAAILVQFGRDRDPVDDTERRRRDRNPDDNSNSGGNKGADGKKGGKSAGKGQNWSGSKRRGGVGDGLATGVGIGLGAAIGGAIVSGAQQCSAQADRCASRYGRGTSRYRRCMDDGGC